MYRSKEDRVGKSLFIAEKPSVAREFANALKVNTTSRDGYLVLCDRPTNL